MKIIPLKFGFGLGIALSISFLLCNIIFTLGGKNFSLTILNTLFHDVDFGSIMIESSFNFVKLMCGMLLLFIEGMFTGYLAAIIYNAMNKRKSI